MEDRVVPYQICSHCVMDTSDPDIAFDSDGVCSWCRRIGNPEPKEGLGALLQKVRWSSNSGCDCVIGYSGGVDSSYLAHLVKRWGLKPYAVTVDSAWVTPEARHNIEAVSEAVARPEVVKLGEGFLDLQLAYLRAGVLNLDAPQNHAIVAALWRAAASNNIKYILTGHNQATESIHPPAWGFPCMDLTNMKAIHKRFGNGGTGQAMPTMSSLEQCWRVLAKGIRVLNPLDYVHYNKKQAKGLLAEKYGWQDYGAEHRVFTRWYQCAVLPRRFSIDKRRSHLSALILSRQVTRSEALEELKKPAYPSEEMERADEEHIAGVLGVSRDELLGMVLQPARSHFATDPGWVKYLRYAVWRLKR